MSDPAAVVECIFDGAIVLIGGFGRGGVPEMLIEAVCDRKVSNLTIVTNNSGTGRTGIARLIEQNCVGRIVCSFPISKESVTIQPEAASG